MTVVKVVSSYPSLQGISSILVTTVYCWQVAMCQLSINMKGRINYYINLQLLPLIIIDNFHERFIKVQQTVSPLLGNMMTPLQFFKATPVITNWSGRDEIMDSADCIGYTRSATLTLRSVKYFSKRNFFS